MKKLLRETCALVCAVALAGQAFDASAEIEIKEVDNYFEGFDNVATGKDQLAIGWHRIPDITNLGTIDTYRVEGLGGMDDERSVNSQVFSVQYQETWDDESGVSYKTDDLILTPELKGHVEFFLKYKGRAESYNTWKPSVNIYKCTDNFDFTYSKGEEIVIDPVSIPTDSWVKVSLDVADWTILGLRLENVYFDSFSATTARIPQVQYLQMTGFTCLDGTTVYTDEKGNADLHFSIKVTNRGNIPISKDQEDFSIELQNSMTTVGTFPIGVDMQPGDVTEFKFTQPWKLKKITEAEVLNLQCVENISRHASSTALAVRVEVFAPILGITLDGAEVKDYIDLKTFEGDKKLALEFANLGGKELNITSLTLPENVKTDATMPLSIAPRAKVPVTFTITASGAVAGNIEIESDGIAPSPSKIHYYGASVPGGTCVATFDGKKLPARWMLENKDAWIGNDRMGEAMRSATSASTAGKLISPLMSFGEGGKVTMSLGRWATWTESKLTVYTSDDRVNWTEVAKVSSKDENTAFPATQWEFAAYEVPVPAGDRYIAVEGLYANIDNLTGGKAVEVDKDLYIHGFTADAKGMVNYPMTATLSLQNLGASDLAAADYTAQIFIDGEKVGEATALPSLSNSAEKASEIAFTFTPHKAVEAGKLTAVVAVGDYEAHSAALDVCVEAEKINATKVVGTFNADRSGSNIPMHTGDNNSYSEFIYTAGQLGLAAGDKIAGIGFPYTIAADRVADKNVRIYMQLTDTEKTLRPEAGKAFDTADMTKVYDGTVTLTKTTPDGTFGKYALLDFALDESFAYDGRNLRVIVETKSSAFIASEFLNFAGGNTVYTSSDNAINLATCSPELLMALPVAVLTLDKEAVAVVGKVTDDKEAPVSGAKVSLTSGDVIYAATTADDGSFAASVMQSALSYTLAVAAHGFKDMELPTAVYAAATDLGALAMTPNVVDASGLAVTVTDATALMTWRAVVPGSLDESVTYDIYLDGNKVKEGVTEPAYTFEDLEAGDHKAGVVAVFAPAGVATAPAEADFSVVLTSLGNVASTLASVAVTDGKIIVTSPVEARAEVYSANGMMIDEKQLDAGATATVAAAPGIYLVTVTTDTDTLTAKVVVR